MKKYAINEIFYSIQGEGYHVGTPAVFIRFAGCNQKCKFCDTDHNKVVFNFTANELGEKLASMPGNIIVLTGGEPLLQVDDALISRLRLTGKRIHCETNGTIIPDFELDWITVSPKKDWILQRGDELKVVIDGYLPKKDSLIKELNALREITLFDHYYLQPEVSKNSVIDVKSQASMRGVANLIKELEGWKISIQMQKVLNIM